MVCGDKLFIGIAFSKSWEKESRETGKFWEELQDQNPSYCALNQGTNEMKVYDTVYDFFNFLPREIAEKWGYNFRTHITYEPPKMSKDKNLIFSGLSLAEKSHLERLINYTNICKEEEDKYLKKD